MPFTRLLTVTLLLLPALACGRDPRYFMEKKPIAEVRHMGFRQDIPESLRGNAVFDRAVFTREGHYLVTAGRGIRVWDPGTGVLLRTIAANLGDGNDLLVADGTHHRVLARQSAPAADGTQANGLGLWDLRDGSLAGVIPDSYEDPAIPVGITAAGDAVVFRGRQLETWALNGSERRQVIAPPEGLQFCQRGTANHVTYNDKQCFELSPSGRWLAVTAWNAADRTAAPRPFEIDLKRGTLAPIPLTDGRDHGGASGFAYSADERTLAIGLQDGMWIRAKGVTEGPVGEQSGLFVAGDHKRNRFLTPMGFTAHDTRLIALGDQLQVSTFDVADGTVVGRVLPPFEDWEGVFRLSADGSRAIVYRFGADILVVLDGATGTQRGFLCPYFCNRFHNPVEVPYAVSPDGRRVASGGRLGAGLWDTDADTLIAPLQDPTRSPRPPQNPE